MSEIGNIVTKKEKIHWEGKPNSGRYFIGIAFLIIIFLIFLILGLFNRTFYSSFGLSYSNFIQLRFFFYAISLLLFLAVIYRILSYNYIAYAITNSRVIIQSGVIGRDYKSIDFDKIQDININVGLFDKIFGTGSISIKTAGVNVVQTKYGQTVVPESKVIGYVVNPYDVAKILKHIAHVK